MEQVITILEQLGIAVPSTIAATLLLTSTLKGIFNIEDKPKLVHIISWVIAVLTSLGFVAFNGLTFGLGGWDYAIGAVVGLLAGAASNGIYDWDKVANLLNALVELLKDIFHRNKAKD